jgi:hypothetical protein
MNNFIVRRFFSAAGGEQRIEAFALFLRGVLRKAVRRTWFFAGENVVKCVVNVVL